MRAQSLCLSVCATAVVLLAGCADIAPPNWFHPGPGEYQRAQAQRTDPYPEPDTGPEMVGARPRDFQKPQTEPSRVQNEYSWSKRYGQPPPGLFRSSSIAPPGQVWPSRYAAAPSYAAPQPYPTSQVYAPPPVYAPAPVNVTPPAYGGQAVRSAGPQDASGVR